MALRPAKCLLPYWLKKRRLTARQLSEITEISETALSDYANKRKIMMLGTAKTIAEALEIPIDDLYSWELVATTKAKSRRKKE